MNESEPNSKTHIRNTVTMGSGEWATASYGFVEFLRTHRALRAVVALLGGACSVVLVGFFMGLKPFPGLSVVPLFVVAPWLLWCATVSGDSFQLVFPTEQARAERQVAERQFDKTQAPEDALTLDFKRLDEYYQINQAQARSSFRWAKFSMFVGFATIVTGIWLFYFRPNEPDKFMSTLSAATGCLINVVSGLFLHLHSKTQDRALHYYEPLARLQRLSLAMRLVDAHKDGTEQTQARNLVSQELLASSRK